MEPSPSVETRFAQEPPRAYTGHERKEPKDRYWLHVGLFLLTLASTVYMGGELVQRVVLYRQAGMWAFVMDGLRFGGSLLLFLTVHEFGHYFAARSHNVSTTLPYYIPLPFFGVGTLGAVIRIREPVPSTRKLFDIGAAGPIAGFVVALAILLYALSTLPPPSYLFDLSGHEPLLAYIRRFGRFPDTMPPPGEGSMTLVVGNTLLYWFLTHFFQHVPPMYEMYHYPILFAGWLGLFFTALNLLPVGQLDGGHILYTLVGPRWHSRLARGFFVLLLISGAIGFFDDIVPELYAFSGWAGSLSWFILAGILYFYLTKIFKGELRHVIPVLLGIIAVVVAIKAFQGPLEQFGYSGWFIWCLLIVFLIKVDHPPVLYREPLTPTRRVLGILSIVIFILCFSFKPLYIL